METTFPIWPTLTLSHGCVQDVISATSPYQLRDAQIQASLSGENFSHLTVVLLDSKII